MAAEDWLPFPYDLDGPEYPEPEDYLDMSDEKLYSETAMARTEKLKSIRKYYKTHNYLSDKQRWCLAKWLADKDEKYI